MFSSLISIPSIIYSYSIILKTTIEQAKMAFITGRQNEGCKAAMRGVYSVLPNDVYLRWDSPGVEDVKPEEEQKLVEVALAMNLMENLNFVRVRTALNERYSILKSFQSTTIHTELPMAKLKALNMGNFQSCPTSLRISGPGTWPKRAIGESVRCTWRTTRRC